MADGVRGNVPAMWNGAVAGGSAEGARVTGAEVGAMVRAALADGHVDPGELNDARRMLTEARGFLSQVRDGVPPLLPRDGSAPPSPPTTSVGILAANVRAAERLVRELERAPQAPVPPLPSLER